MSKQIDALKLALEALEKAYGYGTEVIDTSTMSAINAIKEVLAQPEQGPVAFMFQHDEVGRYVFVPNDSKDPVGTFLQLNPRYHLVGPLYTAPPQRTWVGLTFDDLKDVEDKYDCTTSTGRMFAYQNIETKLKQKNMP